ncbi:LutC/YkgG family protein [Corynebacterium aquatimens]|uniref:L-lactate dehydrogenase complex protein LldG n=1 Tax=Corynebacterium aquatimens TaxID=1190508 RepID=A0A931E085_9CORY|nr:LUD domain-containing protein [Corynebacterium aquatimens]MBG6121356.1 L-lactate dehydrogenase complex protein LldG [Corynebacterium aquatimens]WJY66100.1 Lactate utilization protein C [Corynebacterium aquatimens]
MTNAKQDILTRIRNAEKLADAPASVEHARDYRTESTHSREELKEILIDRLVDYKADVKTADKQGLPQALAEVLRDRECHDVRYAPGLSTELFSAIDGSVSATPDDSSVDPRTLGDVDAVVTSSVVSSAQTGTIVLQSDVSNRAGDGTGVCGRRALSLVPDRHVCIVDMDTVVYGVPEMFAAIDPEKPATLISGPSATSDIELVRVEGVHGPRDLIVIVVD